MRERQTDRQRQRDRERQKERQRHRQTDRQRQIQFPSVGKLTLVTRVIWSTMARDHAIVTAC